MQTTKRIISALLVLSLLFGQLPATVFAAQTDAGEITAVRNETVAEPMASSGTCGDNLTWTLSDDGVLTISGTGAMTNYFGGNSDQPPWFNSRNSIITVIIEDDVSSIGDYAFYHCSRLTSVVIPDSVTFIGNYAFYFCDSLTCVTIPDSVTFIGYAAFYSCTSLTSVTIPDSVTDLGGAAFCYCTSLTSVTIPDSITSINGHTFFDCSSLTSVTIPDSVTSIGYGAFFSCRSLTSVTIPDSVTNLDGAAFYSCTSLTSVTIPDSITSINGNTFYSCRSLTSVTIPDSVTSIDSEAFRDCSSLNDITFCGNAPTFGYNVFRNVSAIAYYPANDPTWTSDVMQNYGGTITWIPYSPYLNVSASVQSRTADDPLLIYPLELNSAWTFNTTLSDVTISSALGEITNTEGPYMLAHADAISQDIILSKADYRDYVLPTVVSETLISAEDPTYALSAYMQKDHKDGKPYISTVFGRTHGSSDPYVDLRVTELLAPDDKTQDIIITACGFGDQDVTYYLAQDTQHRISSTTGVFVDKMLYTVFDDVSTVYAYAVGSDGTTTTPMELKLRRAEYDDTLPEFLTESEFSLLGKDFLKIEISDDIPLLAGAEIDLSAFTFPMGVEVEGDEIKISLGLDLFSSTEDEDGYKWKSFKNLVITDTAKIKSDYKAIETFRNAYGLANGKSWKQTNTANKFNINAIGYIEGKWLNGELVVKEGLISLGGKFTFEYVAQGAVWIIPVYGSVEAGAEVRVSGKATKYLPDAALPFDFNMVLDVEPEVTGGAGVGVKNAVSGGLYAMGTLPTMIEFQDEHMTMDLNGELGVEGEFFILQGKKAILEGNTNLIDWYYGTTPANAAAYAVQDAPASVTTVMSRDYAQSTSRWLGGTDQAAAFSLNSDSTSSMAARGVTFQDLQTSIFSNSQPQLVTFGDQMLLAWVEDDAGRDTYNRMRLVFSVYDPLSDSWSEPAPVWDDGHNDGYPRMVSDGENVWIAWQKVNTTLTKENTSAIDTALENSELCLARFDAQTGTFSDQQMITSNTLYEYSHHVTLCSGSPVVFWAAAAENALSDIGSHTLYRWKNGETEALAQELNYILSIDALDNEITYIMDTDGVLSNSADITAFTVSDSGTSSFDNSKMGAAVTYAGYAPLDGKSTLFLSDMANIYYQQDGEVKTVFSSGRSISGNLSIVQAASGTTIVWTETVEGWNELYAVRYEGGIWSEPVVISNNGELLTQISIVCYDGKLTGVCNTGEYSNGATNLTLFQVNDFTDIALGSFLTLNENELETDTDTVLYVTVYNKGTTNVDEITFTITDTLGTKSYQTVAVELPTGGSEIITLTYPVPERYTSTTLTVCAETREADADDSDNTVSIEIGKQDLAVTETAAEILNGGYLLRAIVENGSLVDAENVTLSICADEEDADALLSVTVGSIARENYALAEILLVEDALTFDENGVAKVYLKLSADGDESACADNQVCVIVTQAVETTCMHPVTETIAAVAPTCTEFGHNSYEICIACGEITSEYEEIAALGHSYKSFVTPSTCTEQGYTTHTCTACGDSYIDNYTNADGHSYDSGFCTVCGAKDPDATVEVASGWSGYTQWVLTDDGMLTIYGEGSMRNYTTKDGMPWYAYADQITTVVIKEGVTSVGAYAFYGMGIESIEIASTVTTIGDYAFKNAEKLDGVVLPERLTKLGESAFYGCTALTSIEIPASLWTVQPYTFKNCTALAEVTFNEGNLMKISDGAFYNTALTELVLPDCLDILDVYSFKNCADLASITIGSGLTEIREAVFYGTAIDTIEIPEGITKIGPYAFKNCVNLETIQLPGTLNSVGEASFYACTALKSVDFPDAVTTIGNYAFRKCAALETVNFGEGLVTIGESSFYGCSALTELVIPDSVTAIEGYAFKGCTALTNVTLGESVTTVGDSAFHSCTSLKTLVFPASVERIGDYCFSGSYNLWKLTFEGDAPSIGSDAFKGLEAEAFYPGDNATWTSDVMKDYGGSIIWNEM